MGRADARTLGWRLGRTFEDVKRWVIRKTARTRDSYHEQIYRSYSRVDRVIEANVVLDVEGSWLFMDAGGKGVTDARPKAIRDLGGAVQSSLRNHKGATVIEHGQAFPMRWTIAR